MLTQKQKKIIFSVRKKQQNYAAIENKNTWSMSKEQLMFTNTNAHARKGLPPMNLYTH